MYGMWRGFNVGKGYICNTFPIWDIQYHILMATIQLFHLWVKSFIETNEYIVNYSSSNSWNLIVGFIVDPVYTSQIYVTLFGHSLCVCRRITVCGLRSWATATIACRGCPRPVPTMRTAAWRWVWTWSKQSREYYSVAFVHQTGTARLLCLVLNASREIQRRCYGE